MGPHEIFCIVSSCLDDHIIKVISFMGTTFLSCLEDAIGIRYTSFWFIHLSEVLLSLRDCIVDVPIGGGLYHMTTSFLHLDMLRVPVAAFSYRTGHMTQM